MALTPEQVRDKWIDALRSGDFAQTTGVLTRVVAARDGAPVGDCCLGVLCKLAVKHGVIEAAVEDPDGCLEYGDSYRACLPTAVWDWAGLTNRWGDYGSGNGLAMENDRGATFEEIAAIIEAAPAGLLA